MIFQEKEFNEFMEEMKKGLEEHKAAYGNSWETTDVAFLYQRVFAKYNEYKLTRNSKKLISLANLIMMLYVRTKGDSRD